MLTTLRVTSRTRLHADELTAFIDPYLAFTFTGYANLDTVVILLRTSRHYLLTHINP
jgi:hypothetical protein